MRWAALLLVVVLALAGFTAAARLSSPVPADAAADAGAGAAVPTGPVATLAPDAADDPHARAAGGTAAGSDPDWWTVLAELDRRRSEVLMAGDRSSIGRYAAPGSVASQSDADLLADLADHGVRPRGLTSRVLAVEGVSETTSGVELQIVDLRSGYDLIDAETSDVVQRVGPAQATRWAVSLVRTDPATRGSDAASSPPAGAADVDHAGERDPGWRVASVRPRE